MALQVWDGFEKYTATADFLSRSGFLQWQTPFTAPTISFVTGRNGFGYAVKVANSPAIATPGQQIRAVWGTRNAEAYFGFAALMPSGTLAPACGLWLQLYDSVAGNPQLTIYFNANNYSVQIFRGSNTGTSIALSANNVWTGEVWQFVEVHAKIDGSSGVVDVRVRGNSVFGGAVTGLNTQATANAWFDTSDFCPAPVVASSSTFIELDDLYYADTTSGPGTFPANTFLGDSRVATLYATANASVQWTPLANANWQEISETFMDSDASYNYSTTPGQEDRFTFGPLAATINVIYGVQVTFAARKDDGGTRTVKSALKSSTTEVYGANHNIPDTNYAYFSDFWILDPNTSSNWTLSGVNNLTAGYNLVA